MATNYNSRRDAATNTWYVVDDTDKSVKTGLRTRAAAQQYIADLMLKHKNEQEGK